MVPTPAPVLKAILGLCLQNFLNPVPDHLFAGRLRLIDPLTEGGDPSRMVEEYDHEWWAPGPVMDLTTPLPWISAKKCVDNHVKQWVSIPYRLRYNQILACGYSTRGLRSPFPCRKKN